MEDVALAEGKVTITCTDVDAQTTDGIRNGMFMGLATYPDKGLRPAASLTCTANDVVSQAEVRATGSLVLLMSLFLRVSFHGSC